MKIWTVEEEAAELRKRFAGVNRAKFAREHSVKGGQAMIYQHINALRPMSLEAATIYAAAFGCPLEEISPRLAREVQAAAGVSSARPGEPSPATAQEGSWPFSSRITPAAYRSLDQDARDEIEDFIELKLKRLTKRKSAAKEKAA